MSRFSPERSVGRLLTRIALAAVLTAALPAARVSRAQENSSAETPFAVGRVCVGDSQQFAGYSVYRPNGQPLSAGISEGVTIIGPSHIPDEPLVSYYPAVSPVDTRNTVDLGVDFSLIKDGQGRTLTDEERRILVLEGETPDGKPVAGAGQNELFQGQIEQCAPDSSHSFVDSLID